MPEASASVAKRRPVALLLAQCGDESHEDESCAETDHEPRKEVVQEDAEPDTDQDSSEAGPPYEYPRP